MAPSLFASHRSALLEELQPQCTRPGAESSRTQPSVPPPSVVPAHTLRCPSHVPAHTHGQVCHACAVCSCPILGLAQEVTPERAIPGLASCRAAGSMVDTKPNSIMAGATHSSGRVGQDCCPPWCMDTPFPAPRPPRSAVTDAARLVELINTLLFLPPEFDSDWKASQSRRKLRDKCHISATRLRLEAVPGSF